jgi:NitT/TauT family transport system ATP-binding protein
MRAWEVVMQTCDVAGWPLRPAAVPPRRERVARRDATVGTGGGVRGCRLIIAQKSFGAASVLEDVELAARPGELVAIVGPSGAGKSTLLNILSGLDRAFDGRLEWEVGTTGRIGYVFQEPRLMPWMSLRRNIELVLEDPAEARDRVDHLLHRVGLADRADAYPGQLSGGMQRRVALARGMAVQPDLLLLDEPFASLDEPTAESLRGLLLDLWREQRNALVLVTHNLREALALADRVLFLSRGPARVVLNETLAPSRFDTEVVRDAAGLERDLLQRHPEILSGIAVEGGTP